MIYYLLFCIAAGAGLVHLARRERSKPVSAVRKEIPTVNDPWVRWARIAFILFVVAVLLALSGCDGSPARPADQRQEPVSSFYDVNLYTDPASGCEYLAQYKGGITPRMDRDGKQVCK